MWMESVFLLNPTRSLTSVRYKQLLRHGHDSSLTLLTLCGDSGGKGETQRY